MRERNNRVAVVLTFAILVLVSGCSRSENPIGGNNEMQNVSMSAFFSKGGATGLAKGDGILSSDSLQIDSAVVVFQRIKFEAHFDSTQSDSAEEHEKDGDGREDNITFKGPFVVHVRDTVTIDFASQILPAGDYDGIKFKIHRIGWGERYEDSDEFNHRPRTINDTSFAGWGIVVWGKVKKNDTWMPFTYRFGGEVEFKLKGKFSVQSAANSVNIVLRFDMASWFRDYRSGAQLDPTDLSFQNRELIDQAIRRSFQNGKCGRDHDRNGYPDND